MKMAELLPKEVCVYPLALNVIDLVLNVLRCLCFPYSPGLHVF